VAGRGERAGGAVCSGSLDPANAATVTFLDAFRLRDRGDEIALFVGGRVAPAKRRDLGDRFETFLAGAERILVGADAHRIGIHRATRSAAHPPLGVLRHGVFVIEGKGGAGRQQAGDATDIAARKSAIEKGIRLFSW